MLENPREMVRGGLRKEDALIVESGSKGDAVPSLLTRLDLDLRLADSALLLNHGLALG